MGFRLVVRTQMEDQKGACRETPGGAAARPPRSRVPDCCVCLVTMVTTGSFCFWTMKNKRFLIYLFDLKGEKFFPDNSQPEQSGQTASPWRVLACTPPRSQLALCSRSFILWYFRVLPLSWPPLCHQRRISVERRGPSGVRLDPVGSGTSGAVA